MFPIKEAFEELLEIHFELSGKLIIAHLSFLSVGSVAFLFVKVHSLSF